MEEIQILDAIERYVREEMTAEERQRFESLRASSPEIDQLVVEHMLFLQQMDRFGDTQRFKTTLNEVHNGLASEGKIKTARPEGQSKVVYLWNRYKKTIAIAACIGGISAIMMNALFMSLTPKAATKRQYQELSIKVKNGENKTKSLEKDVADVKIKTDAVIGNRPFNTPVKIDYKSIGTGFFLDAKGLMITNAHVVKNSKNISVFDGKGKKYNAIVIKLDVARDVAFIKIDDDNFKPLGSLPYGISRQSSDIAESIFTLGYPRDEIVYGEGYLSAKTGFDGDTLSCQISIPANPGNSGGPIFNQQGEVIGILSGKEKDAEAATFAVQSKYIFQALEELKKNPLYKNVKLSSHSSVSGLDKKQQVKKLKDFVFMVKGD